MALTKKEVAVPFDAAAFEIRLSIPLQKKSPHFRMGISLLAEREGLLETFGFS
jgi:hypothetical protein